MAKAKIRTVRSEKNYEEALARIDALMDAVPDSPEFEELDVLVDLVELYESRHEPMGYPSPRAAIEFRMDQANLRPRDLIPFIGSRAKVSEVLSGKRAITHADGARPSQASWHPRGRFAAIAGSGPRRPIGGLRVASVSVQGDGETGLDIGRPQFAGAS